jgi:hypothetical protein
VKPGSAENKTSARHAAIARQASGLPGLPCVTGDFRRTLNGKFIRPRTEMNHSQRIKKQSGAIKIIARPQIREFE